MFIKKTIENATPKTQTKKMVNQTKMTQKRTH